MTKYKTSKADDITIYKVDVQKESELTKKLNVFGVPVLVYYKNGKELTRKFGISSVEQLQEFEKEYFK